MDSVNELAGLIELLLNYHKQGLQVLLGLVRPPRGRAVYDMMSALNSHSEGYKSCKGCSSKSSVIEHVIADNERVDAIVGGAGGWPHIVQVSRKAAQADLQTWRLVADYISCIGTYSVRHTSRLGLLAAKHGLTVREAAARRKDFAPKLAALILEAHEQAKTKTITQGVRSNLAEALTGLMKERGFNMSDLARRLNISRARLWNYVHSRNTPKLSVLMAIAREVGVPVDSLLTGFEGNVGAAVKKGTGSVG